MRSILLMLLMTGFLATTKAQRQRLKFEGQNREYIVYVPQQNNTTNKNLPVVFNFHGSGMTHVEHMFYTNMNTTADKHQFIVVYPLGINKDWNVGFEMSYQKGTNDIGFVKELITVLKSKHKIDEKAIYATGLSRGGFFCQRIAAEMGDVFAAVASVGAPLPDSVKYYNQSKHKISVMQIHGTADEVVKYDGKDKGYASALNTFNYWKEKNNITANTTEKTVKYNDKNTDITFMEAKNKDAAVRLLSIKNGGHTWPGASPFNIGLPLGYTHQKLDANQAIWQFFSEHRK